MIQKLICGALLGMISSTAFAAVSITSATFAYTQNFDSLGSATSSPVALAWTNDSTIAGWSLFTSALVAPPTYRAELGNQDSGSFTSYGASSNSDRALGGIGDGNVYFGSPAAGAIAGYIGVAFTNNSGVALESFTLAFRGEQWRYSSAPAQTMVMEYGFGSTFAAVSSWVAPGGIFNWTSPLFGGTGLGGLDGNSSGTVLNRGGTAAVSWTPGQTLWIRWIERNDVGSDHGLGIDDFSFSVTAVPEPSQWALLIPGVLTIIYTIRRRVGR